MWLEGTFTWIELNWFLIWYVRYEICRQISKLLPVTRNLRIPLLRQNKKNRLLFK